MKIDHNNAGTCEPGVNRFNVIREAAKKDIFLVARPLRKKNLKP